MIQVFVYHPTSGHPHKPDAWLGSHLRIFGVEYEIQSEKRLDGVHRWIERKGQRWPIGIEEW